MVDSPVALAQCGDGPGFDAPRPPVDLSGRYAGQLQTGFCETLVPPPSILDVELLGAVQFSDEETGFFGVRYDYNLRLTTYQSEKVRADCPPIAPGLCTSSSGTARCTLRGTVFEKQTGLTYVYDRTFDDLRMKWCWDDDVDLLQLDLAEPAPGNEEGMSLYQSTLITRCTPNGGGCWGRRWKEGLVEDLFLGDDGIVFNNDNLVPGTLADCENCAQFVVRPLIRLVPYASWWKRVSRNPDQLDLSEPIAGKLVSEVPTDSSSTFDNVVERALLKVWIQKGPIEERNGSESNAEFEERVLGEVDGLLEELHLRPLSGGDYTFGEPGKFETGPLPIFRMASHGGKEVWEPALYTLQVSGARTEEFVRDPPVTGEPTGETTTLPFADLIVPNLRPGQLPIEYPLQALFAIGGKLAMIDSVKRACPNNFTIPELVAQSWVEQLEEGALELTDERNEGVQRAIWSELVVRDGALLARKLINTGLEGLGVLLGDLFDDLFKFESADLRSAKKRAREIEEKRSQIDQNYADLFKLDPEDVNLGSEMARALETARNADLAGELGKISKSINFLVRESMRVVGIENEVLLAIPDWIGTNVNRMARAVKTQTLAGAAKGDVKKLIVETVPAFTDNLLDDDEFPWAWCALTAPLLTDSANTMSMWSVANREEYLADREETLVVANALNRVGSDLLTDLIYVQFAAEAADVSSDVFAAVGTAIKQAKAVSELAEQVKYGLNVLTFVHPVAFVFSSLRNVIEVASKQAYGQAPGMALPADVAGLRTRSISSFRAAAPTPVPVALSDPLHALQFQLHGDDIGGAISTFAGAGTDSLVAAAEADRLAARAFQMAVSSVDPSADRPDFIAALARLIEDRAEFEAIEQQLFEALGDLFVGVLTLAYKGSDDLAYVAERNRVLNLIDVVLHRHSEVEAQIQDVAGRAAALSFVPAVVVESLRIESQATGSDLVSQSPETFDVTATVRNVSTASVGDIVARLAITARTGATTVVGSSDVAVGTLAADDSVAGSGPDEEVVSWEISYSGDLGDEIIDLEVELLEAGEEPVGFVALSTSRRTTIDPEITDADFDRQPDAWESDHGLDPEVDDSTGDLDDDGLVNVAELAWGTDPDDDDSDDDGRSDGEEVAGGRNAEATDPLDPDSDDDGLLDGIDPAPNDPRPQAQPSPATAASEASDPQVALDRTTVTLASNRPVAVVEVSNAGGGTLEWMVDPGINPAFIVTQPPPGEVTTRDTLVLTVPGTFDFSGAGSVTVEFKVRDMGGAEKDAVAAQARVTAEDLGGALCGHASGSAAEAKITAGDALFALRGAVGAFVCERCRCDVDASGKVQASDALLILRHAVGLGVELVCPAC